MSREEATISNMWEMAAIIELLEQKGLCTKQDLYDIITEFRRKNPRARIPETAFPEPYLLTDPENTIIDAILELLNKQGLTSHQSLNVLERLGRIIEMGQRVAKRGRRTKDATRQAQGPQAADTTGTGQPQPIGEAFILVKKRLSVRTVYRVTFLL